MKKNKSGLIKSARKYVRCFFEVNGIPNVDFHTFDHTKDVVRASKKMAVEYSLNHFDYVVLMVAAWFRDTGYLIDHSMHQERSAQIAGQFLERLKLNPRYVANVKKILLSTKNPSRPENLLEEIFFDAGFFYLGENDFLAQNKRLMRESEFRTGTQIANEEWIIKVIDFMRAHKYFTAFANKKANKRKLKNLQLLEKRATARHQLGLNGTEHAHSIFLPYA